MIDSSLDSTVNHTYREVTGDDKTMHHRIQTVRTALITAVLSGLLSGVGAIGASKSAIAGAAAANVCSDFLTPQAINASVVTLQLGERLVGTAVDPFQYRINGGAIVGPVLNSSYTAAANGDTVQLQGLTPGGLTAQCFAATAPTEESSGSSTESVKNALSDLIINEQDDQLNKSISGAAGEGDGTTSPFISENGFSISSRGLASLARIPASKPTIGGELKQKTYPAALDINNVPTDVPWNIWAAGHYSHYEGNGNSFDGGIGSVHAGADYRITEQVLIGAVVGYAGAGLDVGATGNLKSRGFTVGGYFGARVNETVRTDGYLAYTRSDYDVRAGTTTGSFDANRFSLGINVYGSMPMDGFTIEPGIRFVYGSERQDAYTDSTGTAVVGRTVTAGRVSVGPKLIWDPIETGSGSFSPWLGGYYEYSFSNTNAVATTGLPNIGNSSSARFTAGVNTDLGAGVLTLSGEVGGLGSGDYTSYGGNVKLRIPIE